MSNFAVMRCQKIKSMGDLKRALQHDRRERIPKNANPEFDLKMRFREYSKKNIDNYSQVFKNARKNAVYATEWVFSASDMSDIFDLNKTGQDFTNYNKWVQGNIDFVGDIMGGQQNILSCTMHFDEKTPHLHIIAIPVKDNKLNCRAFLGGTKYKMRELQDKYYDKVKCFGFDRGIAKEKTRAFHNNSNLLIEKNKIQENINSLKNDLDFLKSQKDILLMQQQLLDLKKKNKVVSKDDELKLFFNLDKESQIFDLLNDVQNDKIENVKFKFEVMKVNEKDKNLIREILKDNIPDIKKRYKLIDVFEKILNPENVIKQVNKTFDRSR